MLIWRETLLPQTTYAETSSSSFSASTKSSNEQQTIFTRSYEQRVIANWQHTRTDFTIAVDGEVTADFSEQINTKTRNVETSTTETKIKTFFPTFESLVGTSIWTTNSNGLFAGTIISVLQKTTAFYYSSTAEFTAKTTTGIITFFATVGGVPVITTKTEIDPFFYKTVYEAEQSKFTAGKGPFDEILYYLESSFYEDDSGWLNDGKIASDYAITGERFTVLPITATEEAVIFDSSEAIKTAISFTTQTSYSKNVLTSESPLEFDYYNNEYVIPHETFKSTSATSFSTTQFASEFGKTNFTYPPVFGTNFQSKTLSVNTIWFTSYETYDAFLETSEATNVRSFYTSVQWPDFPNGTFTTKNTTRQTGPTANSNSTRETRITEFKTVTANRYKKYYPVYVPSFESFEEDVRTQRIATSEEIYGMVGIELNNQRGAFIKNSPNLEFAEIDELGNEITFLPKLNRSLSIKSVFPTTFDVYNNNEGWFGGISFNNDSYTLTKELGTTSSTQSGIIQLGGETVVSRIEEKQNAQGGNYGSGATAIASTRRGAYKVTEGENTYTTFISRDTAESYNGSRPTSYWEVISHLVPSHIEKIATVWAVSRNQTRVPVTTDGLGNATRI